MNNNDNQPDNPLAFPTPDRAVGMSLRDYFAAAAISGSPIRSSRADDQRRDAEHYARWAYLVADAMLKERETTGK